MDKSLIILALETLKDKIEYDENENNRRIRNNKIDKIDIEIKKLQTKYKC
jgi:hypothetical protein